MRRSAFLLSAMLAFGLTPFGIVTVAGNPSDKSQKLTEEVVQVDPMAGSLVKISDSSLILPALIRRFDSSGPFAI